MTSAIAIRNVSKQFQLAGYRPRALKELLVAKLLGRPEAGEKPGAFWALKDVSFEIERGETFGVIGDNGSGKSTLLKLITGISKPTSGSVGVDGRVSALLELGAGFHPDFSGRENVFLNGAILGVKKQEMARLFDAIVAFSELERFIDQPVKTYSSGMYMRLAFAIAIHVDPDILVIDEVLAVGDAAFQAKCLDQIHRFKHAGKTIVLVSHSLATVREICQRAAWLHRGELRAVGEAKSVLGFYAEQVAEAVGRNKAEVRSMVPDGRATLRGLRALDAAGAPTALLKHNERARFAFEIESTLPADSLDVVVKLLRADGVCCYDQRVRLALFAEGEAAGSYALQIPELRLRTGTYSLQASLAEAGEDDWLDEKFFNFAVDGGGKGPGVASLAGEWTRLAPVHQVSH